MKGYLIFLPLLLSACSPEILGVSVTDAEGVAGILITMAVFGLAWTLKCWIEYLFSLRLEIKKKEISNK